MKEQKEGNEIAISYYYIGYKLWMCASLIVVMIIERMRIIIAEYINISIGALIGEHVDLTI